MTLTEDEYDAVVEARVALHRSLQKRYPPRHARNLATVACVCAFTDVLTGSPADGVGMLIDVCNDVLAEHGLELRELPRN